MDLFGRDDELRAVHAFLDRPAGAGMAGLVLEGEAGIGKSTIWLAGVEAARERGLRVLSSRPAEVELGVAHAGLGDLLEDALGEVVTSCEAPRRRALETALLLGEDAGRAGRLPNARRGRPQRAAPARRAPADPARGRRRPVAGRSVDEPPWRSRCGDLQGENIRLLLARRLGGGSRRTPSSSLRSTANRSSASTSARSVPARCTAILQPRLGRSFARPTLLRIHEAAGGNPFFALELGRALGENVDPTQPLPRPGDAGGARPRSPRRAAGRDAPSAAARLHARPAEARTARRRRTRARVRRPRDRARGRGHPFHAPAARLRALSGRLAERSAPRARATWPRSSTIRSRAPAIGRLQRRSRTPSSPRSSRRRPASRSARGAPIAAAELGEHALRATPAGATRGPPPARARHRSRAPRCRRGSSPSGTSRSSFWPPRRRGRRAPRRSSSSPSSRERNARSRSSRRRSTRGRERCTRGVAALAARSISGASRRGWRGLSAMRAWRSTSPMSSTTTRSAQERCPLSPSSDSTAATQTLPEKPSAPTSSPWPPATVSSFSGPNTCSPTSSPGPSLTERARDLLESHHRGGATRMSGRLPPRTGFWRSSSCERVGGRKPSSTPRARTGSTLSTGTWPRFTCSRSDSSSPIAATSGAPGSWPSLARELADREGAHLGGLEAHRGHRRALERRPQCGCGLVRQGRGGGRCSRLG